MRTIKTTIYILLACFTLLTGCTNGSSNKNEFSFSDKSKFKPEYQQTINDVKLEIQLKKYLSLMITSYQNRDKHTGEIVFSKELNDTYQSVEKNVKDSLANNNLPLSDVLMDFTTTQGTMIGETRYGDPKFTNDSKNNLSLSTNISISKEGLDNIKSNITKLIAKYFD